MGAGGSAPVNLPLKRCIKTHERGIPAGQNLKARQHQLPWPATGPRLLRAQRAAQHGMADGSVVKYLLDVLIWHMLRRWGPVCIVCTPAPCFPHPGEPTRELFCAVLPRGVSSPDTSPAHRSCSAERVCPSHTLNLPQRTYTVFGKPRAAFIGQHDHYSHRPSVVSSQ